MKLVRFLADGNPLFGRLAGERIEELDGSYLEGPCSPTGRTYALNDIKLLCPTIPTKVVCVGLNYRDHAEEVGKPLPEDPCLFIKPETAVIGPGEPIIYPAMTQRMDYEAELAIVIGKPLRNATPEALGDAILGYTCLNDVTARDLQQKDGQWTRAKSFDTFCPVGPWITDEVVPDELEIELLLNGERRQHSNTRHFVFSTAELVGFISRIMTLKPGDVVATGTPSGIGPMQPGDAVEVRIEGIGSLCNTVTSGETLSC